jgi:hypothetical protein
LHRQRVVGFHAFADSPELHDECSEHGKADKNERPNLRFETSIVLAHIGSVIVNATLEIATAFPENPVNGRNLQGRFMRRVWFPCCICRCPQEQDRGTKELLPPETAAATMEAEEVIAAEED